MRHYDLSNELFGTFLDETMTYSGAWFAPGRDDLAEAQRRKVDGILDLAGVRSGMHVLEIGTGWGALATRAARRGARVTTLTISAEQARLAEQRLTDAGVAERVQVLLRALLALHHPPGLAGLLSAALMTWLLARGTGASLLESTIGDRRPGYADYIARTSGFVPLPPKRTTRRAQA
jgi:hypothetical protein